MDKCCRGAYWLCDPPAADSGASYSRKHSAVAAAIIVALILGMEPAAYRSTVAVLGGARVLSVAFSRVYLADHYLLDVLASLLVAMASGCIAVTISSWGSRLRDTRRHV